jgi:hypothetical protein
MKRLREAVEWLLASALQVVVIVVILWLMYEFYVSDIGHWYLCDTPGNTRPGYVDRRHRTQHLVAALVTTTTPCGWLDNEHHRVGSTSLRSSDHGLRDTGQEQGQQHS